MKKIFLLLGISALVLATRAPGQVRLEEEPGFVDLTPVETWFGDEPFLFVNVKGALLKLVAEASKFEDPDLAGLLHRLKAVQVRGFKNRGADIRTVRERADNLAKSLAREDWEAAVRVREDDEQVDLYLKSEGDVIAGLMVMVIKNDEDETVFVNIVGDIDPEQIGRIGRKFNIGELERDW